MHSGCHPAGVEAPAKAKACTTWKCPPAAIENVFVLAGNRAVRWRALKKKWRCSSAFSAWTDETRTSSIGQFQPD
jgi:hypothetical protein